MLCDAFGEGLEAVVRSWRPRICCNVTRNESQRESRTDPSWHLTDPPISRMRKRVSRCLISWRSCPRSTSSWWECSTSQRYEVEAAYSPS